VREEEREPEEERERLRARADVRDGLRVDGVDGEEERAGEGRAARERERPEPGEEGEAGEEYGDSGNELYDQAVAIVLRDRKASTSYIQRRLGIGYNRAASLVERMEKEGLIGAANHAGKREILVGNDDAERPY